MPNHNVKNVLKQFRARFQSDMAELPLSLRQESNEIIFVALLEDDESPMPPPTPMLGFSPEQEGLPPMSNQQDIVMDLMNASKSSQELGAAPPPMPPALPQGGSAPQQGPSGAPAGGNPLEDLLGMM